MTYIKNADGQWSTAPMVGTWTDIGCPDFPSAKVSRAKITNHDYVEFYIILERWLSHTARSVALPDWLTIGKVPSVSAHDWDENSSGFHKL